MSTTPAPAEEKGPEVVELELESSESSDEDYEDEGEEEDDENDGKILLISSTL